MVDPTQSAPPLLGLGLVHVLVCVHVPTPHVTEHGPHTEKSVKPPFISTETGLTCLVHSYLKSFSCLLLYMI